MIVRNLLIWYIKTCGRSLSQVFVKVTILDKRNNMVGIVQRIAMWKGEEL